MPRTCISTLRVDVIFSGRESLTVLKFSLVIRLPSPREVKPFGRDRGRGGLSFMGSLSWNPRTPEAVHRCVWGTSVSLKLCARRVHMFHGGEKIRTYL